MPTLAHEGNPKQDEIIITSGSVLSTATLEILLRQGGATPGLPASAPLDGIQTSCSDIFEWAGLNDNQTFMGSASGRDWIYLSDSPCFTTNGSRTRWADSTLELRINSTPTCYGVLWKKITPTAFPSSNPANCARIDWRTSFNGVIDGTPRAGPCVWVSDGSTHTVASLYAAVCDFDDNTIKLCKWDGASLASLDNATVLGTISQAPSIGDIIWLAIYQRPEDAGVNGVSIDLRDSTFATSKASVESLFDDTTQQAVFNQSTDRHDRCSVGFVSVGGKTAGKLEFKHSFITSCGNQLTPWMDIDSSGGN